MVACRLFNEYMYISAIGGSRGFLLLGQSIVTLFVKLLWYSFSLQKKSQAGHQLSLFYHVGKQVINPAACVQERFTKQYSDSGFHAWKLATTPASTTTSTNSSTSLTAKPSTSSLSLSTVPSSGGSSSRTAVPTLTSVQLQPMTTDSEGPATSAAHFLRSGSGLSASQVSYFFLFVSI